MSGRGCPANRVNSTLATSRSVRWWTLHSKPLKATHWRVRAIARATGLSPGDGPAYLEEARPPVSPVKAFKLSRDPRILEKLKDVAGLYLDPPEKAIVFSVDQKSQIQALDRAAQAVRGVAPATLVKRNRRDWHSRLPLAMHHLKPPRDLTDPRSRRGRRRRPIYQESIALRFLPRGRGSVRTDFSRFATQRRLSAGSIVSSTPKMAASLRALPRS